MTQQITDVAVESIGWSDINSTDLAIVLRDKKGPNLATYKIVPIGADGYRQSVVAEMVFDDDAKRAGIAWGADAMWTDATDPVDAAERFFGINGKEMCN